MKKQLTKSVLFIGQCYYNHWYLSRELRKIGWKADLLNIDSSLESQKYYHGEDKWFYQEDLKSFESRLEYFAYAIENYSIFHFANAWGIHFFSDYFGGHSTVAKGKTTWKVWWNRLYFKHFILRNSASTLKFYRRLGNAKVAKLLIEYFDYLPARWDIMLLKKLGKKIVYTNNGCLDGVTQTSFSKWPTPTGESICEICAHKSNPSVCSDERNNKWGKYRNWAMDYQCLLGGNQVDFNAGKHSHETPWVYCLDSNFWSPDLTIPDQYKLSIHPSTIKVYHAVGNYDARSSASKTIKSTHIYIPLIEKLKKEGYPVELIFFKDVPNKEIRYYQAQADILVDMLSFGFFGANVREGLMLGKPCVCYLREEWLDSIRKEVPGFVEELPIVNANELTIEEILKDLINNPGKRTEIGKKSREFALKWFSSDQAALKFDAIYSQLLNIKPAIQ